MLRHIRVNNQWIDTLKELKENHKTYIVIDGSVICIHSDNTESYIGTLQEERD